MHAAAQFNTCSQIGMNSVRSAQLAQGRGQSVLARYAELAQHQRSGDPVPCLIQAGEAQDNPQWARTCCPFKCRRRSAGATSGRLALRHVQLGFAEVADAFGASGSLAGVIGNVIGVKPAVSV